MIEKIKLHILPLIYAYIICSFLYWDCNVAKWDFEQRVILIIVYAIIWLASVLVSCYDSFNEDEDYIDDFDDE